MATIAEALLIAVDHHRAGRTDAAETLYARILEADAAQPDALHLLGVLCGQRGETGRALELMAAAIRHRPADPDIRANRARLLGALGGDAGTAWRGVLALDPGRAEAWEALGRAATVPDRASERLDRAHRLGAVGVAGPLAGLRAARGAALIDRGLAAQALPDLEAACRLGATDAATWCRFGNALADLGRRARSLAVFRAALCLNPGAHAVAYNLGVTAREEGRFREAATVLAHAVALAPAHLDAAEHLTQALHDAGRDGEAAARGAAILADKERISAAEAGTVDPLPLEPADPGRRSRDVIAFSLWGRAERYLRGAAENVVLAAELYPGWVCRVYHDDSVPADRLAALAAAGAELVAMEPGSGPVSGLYWRFLVSDDPTVRRFLCRDADSRVNRREAAAVAAWIGSGLPFHVMRDHVCHTELMLAGMWGGLAGLLPPLAPLIAVHARPGADRLTDQRFLRAVVWPRIRRRCLVHDGVHPGQGVPFPPVPIDDRFAFTHVGACVHPD